MVSGVQRFLVVLIKASIVRSRDTTTPCPHANPPFYGVGIMSGMSEEMTTVGRVQVRHWAASTRSGWWCWCTATASTSGATSTSREALVARGACRRAGSHRPRAVARRAGAGRGLRAVVDDLRAVVEDARGDLPVVMVGHSMGGLIATRYAQRHGEDLAGLVLSGPAIGLGPVVESWLAPEPPSDPIEVAVLSRDPAVGEAYVERPARLPRRLEAPDAARRSPPPTRRSPRARASATSRCSTSTAPRTARPGRPCAPRGRTPRGRRHRPRRHRRRPP